MDRTPNIGILLLWPGVALIAFDHYGYTAAGIALIVGWFIGTIVNIIDEPNIGRSA